MTDSKISIILPVLNEAEVLKATLESLQSYRKKGHEIIVVDGGSLDKTLAIALPLADRVVRTSPGRAIQMNEGAFLARSSTLLFLHSDTRLPEDADGLIQQALFAPENVWGRFSLKLTGSGLIFRLIESTINWRTFISGIATGDQGIFIKKEMFEKVGCYRNIPLMEDVALGKALLKYARPRCLPDKVLSSSRRWEKNGIIKTVLLMWKLRIAYFFGADPAQLVKAYYKTSKAN